MSVTGFEAREQVWLTVIDPDRARLKVGVSATREAFQVSVPNAARYDDFVLGWVTGGVGIRYLFRIVNMTEGPRRAVVLTLETLEPAVSKTQLEVEPELESWWLVDSDGRDAVHRQQRSLTLERQWSPLLRVLRRVAPPVADRFHESALDEPPPTGTLPPGGESSSPALETVGFLDEGSPDTRSVLVTRALANVLARASAINEKRDSFDVSFSSLLLALLYSDDVLGLWLADYFAHRRINITHVLSKVRKDVAGARAAARQGSQQRDAILSSPLRRTRSARQAFEHAATIAEGQGVAYIETAHLIAAFIALIDYHDEDFGALTLDRQQWGEAFVRLIASRSKNASEVDFWKRFYSRRFPGHELPPLEPVERSNHRPDYDADAYTSRDLLSIDDEVAALAYVVAARQTRPPIAIGLFGEWGSGKTFFMKHLQRRIEQLCKGARQQPVAQRDCHGQIAQIEFNAWHYQEGDLWASLVDHILRNLRFGEDEDEAKLSERRDQMLGELGTTEARQTAAAERAAEADKRVGEAEQRVAELKGQEQARRDELAATLTPGRTVAAVRAGITMNAGLQAQGEQLLQEIGSPLLRKNAAELQEALSETLRELAGVWAFLVPLWRARDRTQRVVLLGLAIGVPVALALGIDALMAQQGLIGKLAGFAGGLASFLATARTWISSQREWVRAFRARVEPVARAVDDAVNEEIEAALTNEKMAVANKMAELESLRQEQARALRERDEAATQAVELKTGLSVLGDDALMRTFLDDRIGGGLYQQKLGTAALVRRDFERLSRKIEQVTMRETKGTLREPGGRRELVINRIVLYVDDLDRCEMNKVVPVLRAVHLLLAFPAFVVVVGVDSRWVARCLEQHHQDIFTEENGGRRAAVTPLDYLEKIFQIPIWLEPVPLDRRVLMVQQLLRKPGAAVLQHPPPLPAAEEKSEQRRTGEAVHVKGTDVSPSDPPRSPQRAEQPHDPVPAITTSDPPAADVESHEPDIDLNPKGLTITHDEHEFIERIGPLLSSSPRTIKRFVNTYRLINVALAQQGIEDSDLEPADFQIRLLLLAILVDMPELSRWLQEEMRSRPAPQLEATPLYALLGPDDETHAAHASVTTLVRDRMRVREWLGMRGKPWTTMPSARLTTWLDPVGRYTFNLTRSAIGRRAQSPVVHRTKSD